MKIHNPLSLFIAISVAISSPAFASEPLEANEETAVISETQANPTDNNSHLALNQDTSNNTSFNAQNSNDNNKATKETKDTSGFWNKLKKKNHSKSKNNVDKKSKPKKTKNLTKNSGSHDNTQH